MSIVPLLFPSLWEVKYWTYRKNKVFPPLKDVLYSLYLPTLVYPYCLPSFGLITDAPWITSQKWPGITLSTEFREKHLGGVSVLCLIPNLVGPSSYHPPTPLAKQSFPCAPEGQSCPLRQNVMYVKLRPSVHSVQIASGDFPINTQRWILSSVAQISPQAPHPWSRLIKRSGPASPKGVKRISPRVRTPSKNRTP